MTWIVKNVDFAGNNVYKRGFSNLPEDLYLTYNSEIPELFLARSASESEAPPPLDLTTVDRQELIDRIKHYVLVNRLRVSQYSFSITKNAFLT